MKVFETRGILIRSTNKGMSKQSQSASRSVLSHSPTRSQVFFIIFFHLAFLWYSFCPPSPPKSPLSHIDSHYSHFFLSHPALFLVPFSSSPSLWLSGHPQLFYSSRCNGANVKEKARLPFPPVAFTTKAFDQFVAGARDPASTLQRYIPSKYISDGLC